MTYLFASIIFFKVVVAVHLAEVMPSLPKPSTSLKESLQFERYTIPEEIHQRTACNYETANQTFYSLNNIVKEGNPQDQIKREKFSAVSGVEYDF